MKNITLAIEEELLAKGRKYAEKNNMSFNGLVRDLVQKNVSPEATENNLWLTDLFSLMDKAQASSMGDAWTRGDVRHG